MPEWYKIRAEVTAGAGTVQELAQRFGVAPKTICAAFRRMPDGKEQRRQMQENLNSRPDQPTIETGLPSGAAQRLHQLARHYDRHPVPQELADLAAELLRAGTGLRPIAVFTRRPPHVVQGWAAQGGHLTVATRARHDEIREAIECGAESMNDVADLTGLTRERVRQLVCSMPDKEEVYSKLHYTRNPPTETAPPELSVTPIQETIMPEPAARLKPGPKPDPNRRKITKKETERLVHLIDRARNVQRNAPPAARRIFTVRDDYVRKLLAEGLSIADLAEAAEVRPDSVRDWASPAKTYRRQLLTEAIARKQRAKRRS
jgi:bacterioferritin-associated ferredoxin